MLLQPFYRHTAGNACLLVVYVGLGLVRTPTTLSDNASMLRPPQPPPTPSAVACVFGCCCRLCARVSLSCVCVLQYRLQLCITLVPMPPSMRQQQHRRQYLMQPNSLLAASVLRHLVWDVGLEWELGGRVGLCHLMCTYVVLRRAVVRARLHQRSQ